MSKILELLDDASKRDEIILPCGVTQQEELFCQEYVKHGDLKRSAEAAGIFPGLDNIDAKKISSKQRVKNRIVQLNVQSQIRSSITVDKVLHMMLEIYEAAMADHKYGDANKAVAMLADYVNLFSTRTAQHITEQNTSTEERLTIDAKRYASAIGVELKEVKH